MVQGTAMKYSKTTYMALCGLFAALTAVCSYISIPLGFTPVPVNLATLAVFLAGGLLGKKYGTVALSVYVLLGAVGLPVFSEFRGGLGVIAGPTGGYIIGYIAAAFLVGLIIETGLGRAARASRRSLSGDGTSGQENAGTADIAEEAATAAGKAPGTAGELALCAAAMVVGLAACYALGTAWFMFTTNTGIWASLIACVFPFLPGDGLKIVAATLLVQKLRHLL